MAKNLGAIILCGGQSSRMGRAKALIPFGPELMLQRVVRLIEGAIAGGPIVVVAAPGQELPWLPDTVIIARDPVTYRGPMQGLAVGLGALPGDVELAYASATDAPFLQGGWITRLAERIGDKDIAMPVLGGYPQPLSALYRRATVLPIVRELIALDRMRPVYLTELLPTCVLVADDLRDIDPTFGTIRNMNTPEEYDRALAEAGFPSDGSA